MERGEVSAGATLKVLTALVIVLPVLFFTFPIGYNDLEYFWSAKQFASGESQWNTFFAFRTALVLPMSAAMFVSLYYVANWIYYAILVFAVAALARRFAGETAALIAGVVSAVVPVCLTNATLPNTDVPLAAFIALSAFFYMRGLRRERAWHWFLFSGACVGLGFLAKELAVYCLLMPIVLSAASRKWKTAAAFFLVGFLFILALDAIFFKLVLDDYLARYRFAFGKLETGFGSWTGPLGDRLTAAVPSVLFNPFDGEWVYSGPLFYLAFAMAVWVFAAKKHNLVPVIAWLLFGYLVLLFGSTSPFKYQPLAPAGNYAAFLIPPAAILAGALGRELYYERRRIFIAVFLAAAAVWLYSDYAISADSRTALEPERNLAKMFSGRRGVVLHAGPATVKMLAATGVNLDGIEVVGFQTGRPIKPGDFVVKSRRERMLPPGAYEDYANIPRPAKRIGLRGQLRGEKQEATPQVFISVYRKVGASEKQ
jgi:hypothetical protein